jgi:hypothetical protein
MVLGLLKRLQLRLPLHRIELHPRIELFLEQSGILLQELDRLLALV